MSILNMPSDGLFNVLIVLTRAIVRLGPKPREELLKACGQGVDAIDAKQLTQTLNRWTELGLFTNAEGLVALAEPYGKTLGKNSDIAEARLPNIARFIAMSAENNTRFWESEGNKSADLSRGLSWILAQDIYALDTGSHKPIATLEGEQISDKEKRIFQNDTRWNGLRTWMVYLGFARGGAQVTVDPTIALRDVLPEIFGSDQTLTAPLFVERAALALPVLDGGAYRRQIEAILKDSSWRAPREARLSTSLSRAIQRLDRDGLIATEQRSDAEQGVTLVGAGDRSWRNITHVRQLTAKKSK